MRPQKTSVAAFYRSVETLSRTVVGDGLGMKKPSVEGHKHHKKFGVVKSTVAI